MSECYIASLNAISTFVIVAVIGFWLTEGLTALVRFVRRHREVRRDRQHLAALLEAERRELEQLRTTE